MDIQKQRALYGLPPKRRPGGMLGRLFLSTALVVALSVLAGKAAGLGLRFYREQQLYSLFENAMQSSDPAVILNQLQVADAQFRSLELSDVRLILSTWYGVAASYSPTRKAYLRESLLLAQWVRQSEAWGSMPGHQRFQIEMQIAFMLQELGRDTDALAHSEAANLLLEDLRKQFADSHPELIERLQTEAENLQAYLLASSQNPQVRDGKKALRLAQVMIARDQNTENASLLDTLAESYYAAGNPEQARKIQREALARADASSLWILLKHYDAYTKAAAEEGE